MLLQTFHNADIQLNCDCAWLFGSLFTPTTLLQSHTSNYLHAGVSTYGYDSFCLTTAINTGVRDQNCSSESVTDDRYGKRFSMIFCTHGGRGDFKGRRRGRKKGEKSVSTRGGAAAQEMREPESSHQQRRWDVLQTGFLPFTGKPLTSHMNGKMIFTFESSFI